MNNTNSIYISKPLTFKYSFSIEHKEYHFSKIKDMLKHSLLKYDKKFEKIQKEYEWNDNIIYDVINDRFQKHFSFLGNVKACLTDYSENRGSLVISFSVLVFGVITNYGSIRSSIDYFGEDIERLFYRSLKNVDGEFSVTQQKVQDTNNHKDFLIQQTQTNNANQFDILLSKVKLNRVFIGIIFFVLLLFMVLYFSNLNINDLNNSNTQKQDKIDELIIRKLIEDEIRHKKIEFLYDEYTKRIEKEK
ncbi:MAG: hypothetical protein FWC39_01215 [Bacteroidetes bacterium]|nr:hypothetical protein [Bacteroidota bacterium]